MSIVDENKFLSKYENSIIQMIVFGTQYDIRRPFSEPIPNFAKGSAFIIDSKRGILLTNSHVVEDILSVKGLAPKTNQDIRMRLISICKDKDLAIVQVFKEDWDILTQGKDPKSMEMELEDTLHLKSMTRVVAIGYPLGQDNLKYTPGAVSGFETLNNDSSSKDEDDINETVSYIQTTAPTNPGNSGGPLVNIETGKVIGVISAGIITAQNVGYAVSSRTIWSCLHKMMEPIISMNSPPLFASIQTSIIPSGGYVTNMISSINSPTKSSKVKSIKNTISTESKNTIHLPNVIRLPQTSLTYCRTSEDLINYYQEHILEDKNIEVKGIYITKIQNDSVFDFLKEGFILSSIACQTKNDEIILADIDNSSKITCIQYTAKKKINGDIFPIDEKNFNKIPIDRKFTFKELIDIFPIDANINITYVGKYNNTWGKWNINSTYSINKNYSPVETRFLHFEPIEYEIVAGLCLATLCTNHKDLLPDGSKKFIKGHHKYEKHVVVTFIFSDTDISEIRSIVTGDIIKTINHEEIETISDVRKVLKNKNKIIEIIAHSGNILIINSDKARKQDMAVMNAYQVRNHEYLV